MRETVKRFFTSQILESSSRIVTLDQRESHHLKDVLRLKEGERCFIFDALGNEWTGLVHSVARPGAIVITLVSPSALPIRKYRLTVAQGIPQRGKMDLLVEKASELGVDVLIPMVTERTMVRMDQARESQVLGRWEKIVQEARKQSRSRIPTRVVRSQSFSSVLANIEEPKQTYLFHPTAHENLFEQATKLRSLKRDRLPINVTVLIGPEGGFSKGECAEAQAKGLSMVRLGDTILKTDTAFISIVGILQLALS